MVNALVDVIRALRFASPYLTFAGLAGLALSYGNGLASPRARLINRLASTEYTGVDHLHSVQVSHSHGGSVVRQWFAGTGLAIVAIVLVGASSGIESEVVNGPIRPIDAAVGLVSNGPATLVLQSPGITFMDDSAIPASAMTSFAQSAPFPVVPFNKYLFNVNDRSALEIAIPDALYAKLIGQPVAPNCQAASIVVDSTVGAHVGSVVTVDGAPMSVAKIEPGIAQMNRSIAILADSTARRCVLMGTSTSYFGAIVSTGDVQAVRAALATHGLTSLAVVSESSFKEHNRNFWRANATPLLLQIILYLTLFSGLAAAGERQSALQRNSREIGMLHAGGVDFRTLRRIELTRALRTTFTAALVAGPLLIPVAAAFNASELGVRISVGFTELSVGVALTLLATLTASWRALASFERSLDLTLAVKG